MRFFYINVLKRNWSVAETPYPRKLVRLPQILGPEELDRLSDARGQPVSSRDADDSLCYWERCAEAAYLKMSDIDSQWMVVHIHGGRGQSGSRREC